LRDWEGQSCRNEMIGLKNRRLPHGWYGEGEEAKAAGHVPVDESDGKEFRVLLLQAAFDCTILLTTRRGSVGPQIKLLPI
jgi:hypothetical protein